MVFSIAATRAIAVIQLHRDSEYRAANDTTHEHQQCGEFAHLGGLGVTRALEHTAAWMVTVANWRIHEFEHESSQVAAHFASSGGAGESSSQRMVMAQRRRGAAPEV